MKRVQKNIKIFPYTEFKSDRYTMHTYYTKEV